MGIAATRHRSTCSIRNTGATSAKTIPREAFRHSSTGSFSSTTICVPASPAGPQKRQSAPSCLVVSVRHSASVVWPGVEGCWRGASVACKWARRMEGAWKNLGNLHSGWDLDVRIRVHVGLGGGIYPGVPQPIMANRRLFWKSGSTRRRRVSPRTGRHRARGGWRQLHFRTLRGA